MILEDEDLGRLVVRINPRARRLTFHTRADAVYITIPPGTTDRYLKETIDSLRPKLREARCRVPAPRLIDLDFRIDTPFFKFSLVSGRYGKFLAHSKPGETTVTCPPDTNFNDPQLQQWLHKVIEESLRHNAKLILPQRLHTLSAQHHLPCNNVKINSSRSRWGSCSAKKDINLSYFILLLPQHLVDYILLHELCHTKEMNHSDRFWTLLNAVTQHNALQLRDELKKYKTDF